MTTRLADRIAAARRRRFVGRDVERALFRSALQAPELPFYVLHVYGPGGIGKTTLLKELASICEETGTPYVYIDARNVEPAPEAFITALQLALGAAPDHPGDVLAARRRRHVIFIDTYELLAPLDSWLRELFLPQLPDDTLVVFADRRPPSPAWNADPGWQDVIRLLPLRNLDPDESREYLARRAIPGEQHTHVLNFTHGHPLALSLVADVFAQRGEIPRQPEAAPDVVKALLEQLVQKVPGPAHRAALELCALVRVTTEALLTHALGVEDAHDLFDWLRGLSFIESGPLGLFPHDLAREALAADLRWRNRDWYDELHRRARSYYTASLQRPEGTLAGAHKGLEQQRVLFDYVFLHRDNPLVRPFIEWQESGTMLPDALRDEDVPTLVAMVAEHEGQESAWIADHWLRVQPEGVLVFRDAERQAAGFMVMLALDRVAASGHPPETDPAVSAALRYLDRHAPLRPGETATHFRFWMARDTYQAVSPIQSLIFINAVRHYISTPGLVFTFFPCADPEFWAPLFGYADLPRIKEADFEVGGRAYGVYGHNWRAVPPMAWLAILAERETALAPPSTPPSQAAAPVVVLSKPGFTSAVHDSLRSYTRPEALRGNPLLQSRLIVERVGASAGAQERTAALQALIAEKLQLLQRAPREAKLYRALYHTFVQPAPTQERAAELLDLPFSTYRRHLKEGVARLAELLWELELHGTEG